MNMRHLTGWAPAILGAVVLLAGCGGRPEPLEPIALTEIPTQTTNLFAAAPAEIRGVAYQGLAALEQRDVTRAWGVYQALAARPELTKEQRRFAARAVAALSEEMQRTAAGGDPRAAQALRTYGASK